MKKIFSILFCAVLFCFLSVSPSFAYTLDDLPELPSWNRTHYYAFIYEHTDGTIRLIYYGRYAEFEYGGVFDGTDYIFTASDSSGVTWQAYSLNNINDTSWTQLSSGSETREVVLGSRVKSIIYSDIDIYDTDGNLVFPEAPALPLHLMILELVTVELQKIIPIVVGAMKILALCGVGCLVLLMVFPLFGKVSRIFRLR